MHLAKLQGNIVSAISISFGAKHSDGGDLFWGSFGLQSKLVEISRSVARMTAVHGNLPSLGLTCPASVFEFVFVVKDSTFDYVASSALD